MAATMPGVFVSYSSEDVALVTQLINDLKQAGVDVWLDHERLKPGEPDWQAAVLKGIEQAAVILYVASPDAAISRYVGHELAIARDEEKTILPFWVRGEKWSRCTPMGYYYAQHVDGRGESYAVGLAALLVALGTAPAIPPERFPPRLAALGYVAQASYSVEWIIPPLCPVPSGPFRLGSDKAHDDRASDNELQRITVTLTGFELARFPVTVAEYACFLNATKRVPPTTGAFNSLTWENQLQRLDHPVVNVTWHDAFDYAVWLAKRAGQPWRLPTEAEWEKAARCDASDPLGMSSERSYPWGDLFDAARCNTSESKVSTTTPVGWYGPDNPDPQSGRKSGASPCGAEELAGNVWEWTASVYAADYSACNHSVQRDSTESRAARGGSWFLPATVARAAYRFQFGPSFIFASTGFRVARGAAGSSS